MQPNSPPGFDKYQVSSFAGLNVSRRRGSWQYIPPVPAMSAELMEKAHELESGCSSLEGPG
jgi:hypothetical protein